MESRANEDCSICLEPLYSLGSGESLLSTPCDHLFHNHCLSRWFHNGVPGNCCPLCKSRMFRTEATPLSLEQAMSSTSSRRSRAPGGPTDGGMSMSTVETFQREIERLTSRSTAAGILHDCQVLLEGMNRLILERHNGGTDFDFAEWCKGVQQSVHENRATFGRMKEEYAGLEQRHEQVKQYFKSLLQRFEGRGMLDSFDTREYYEILEELLEVHHAYMAFQSRVMQIQMEYIGTLERFMELCDSRDKHGAPRAPSKSR